MFFANVIRDWNIGHYFMHPWFWSAFLGWIVAQTIKMVIAAFKKKNFDFIVLNSLKDEGAGFRTDTNKITILTADGKKEYPLKMKAEVAKDIVDELERMSVK